MLVVLYSLFKKLKKEEKTNRALILPIEKMGNTSNSNVTPININIDVPRQERSPYRYSDLNKDLTKMKNEAFNAV